MFDLTNLKKEATRKSYGVYLNELAKKNDKIVVLDGDLAEATQTKIFKKENPDRFFDIGIAEQNVLGMAAGFAHEGLIPFASTFAIFGSGRAYEIIRNAIAYENLNVKICLTHAGLAVGEDGGSHQALEDIALMSVLPNMKVFVPVDKIETEKILDEVVKIDCPCYVRLGRAETEIILDENYKFVPGKASVIIGKDLIDKNEKIDVSLISYGGTVIECIKAANELESKGLKVAVINMSSIKPIDADMIKKLNNISDKIVTVEDHMIIGGLAYHTAFVLAKEKRIAKFIPIGVDDVFGRSGKPSELYHLYGIDKDGIVKKINEA